MTDVEYIAQAVEHLDNLDPQVADRVLNGQPDILFTPLYAPVTPSRAPPSPRSVSADP